MARVLSHVALAIPHAGAASSCRAVGIARATYYRHRKQSQPRKPAAECRVPGRSLSLQEQEQVLSCLHSDRFRDMAPPQVYATLLDEGVFLCSISTMYRLLRKRSEVRDRRRLRSHAPSQRPELQAIVHPGRVEQAVSIRAETLAAAYSAHPQRFVNKQPEPQMPPKQVWINPPDTNTQQ